MTTKRRVKLKPCPFCASSDYPPELTTCGRYIVCMNPACQANQPHAIEAWNTRKAP